jgi:hypothetical protein
MILVGGTTAPSYNLNPGVTYEVPLYELVLASGAAEYTAANVAAGDIRVWVVDGMPALAGSKLPDLFPGRLWTKPFEGKLILGGFGSESWTFTADDQTGVLTALAGAPPGFQGEVKGWQKDGIAELEFSWTRTATGGTITNVDVDTGPLPVGWRPKATINRLLFAANLPIRASFPSGNSFFRMNNVTISPGNVISGGFTYVIGS